MAPMMKRVEFQDRGIAKFLRHVFFGMRTFFQSDPFYKASNYDSAFRARIYPTPGLRMPSVVQDPQSKGRIFTDIGGSNHSDDVT